MIMNIILVFVILLIFYSFFKGISNDSHDCATFLSKDATGSLRGFAILMIMFAHICQYDNSLKEILIGRSATYNFIFGWGALGVSVFFFLSGYGCYLSVSKKNSRNNQVWKWLGKHIIQMFIHYAVAFAIVIMILIVVLRQNIDIREIIKCFITLRLPGCTVWYFKIQILFYIILAVAMITCKEKAWIAVLVMSLMYALLADYGIRLPDYWWKTALCFSCGCIVAQFREKIAIIMNSLWAKVLCVILMCFSYFLILKDGHCRIYVQLPAYMCIAFTITILWCSVVRNNKLYSIIGKISLDLYLIHIGIVESVFMMGMDTNFMIVVFMITSGVLAVASYFFSEKIYKAIRVNDNLNLSLKLNRTK